MTLVKICGIMDPETAYFSAKLGADWIGIILVPESRRCVNLEAANEICLAAHAGGAKTVAVFYAMDDEVIQCLPLDGVQIYAPHRLSNRLVRFYANHCPLNNEDGYLLLDNAEGGAGVPLEPSLVFPTPGRKWFLAGGLSPKNVRACIDRFNPEGVDVSSGVEHNGRKAKDLIKMFIEEVRCG